MHSVVLSLVWAFLPFKFALTIFPALCEMHSAVGLCRQELLCESDQNAAEESRAETVLSRVKAHVAAAAITCGRSSEVYGLVIPVRHVGKDFFFAVSLFCFLFFVFCFGQAYPKCIAAWMCPPDVPSGQHRF
jgi:hypothetical protein